MKTKLVVYGLCVTAILGGLMVLILGRIDAETGGGFYHIQRFERVFGLYPIILAVLILWRAARQRY